MTIVIDKILKAKTRTELFGSGDDGAMRQTYRKLARESHPDMFSNPKDKLRAEKAFKHLTHLWENTTKVKPANASLIVTKKHSYDLGAKIHEDDVFMAYNATYDAGHEKCELWITRNPQDNDLGQKAGNSLKKLNKEVPEQFKAFYPEFVELFKYRQGGMDRTTVAQKIPEGFVSLAEVKKAYPLGIHGRDIAWMFKRMLVAIGNTYDAGLVHGGISAEALMIHPEFHGLILRNWQYSVEKNEPLTAIDGKVRDNYPESVFRKEPQGYALDVRMAAKVAQGLLSDKAARQLRIFLTGCMVTSMPHPAELLAEFDELLLRVYGPPKFHVFEMP
jgi:hypothetical protein